MKVIKFKKISSSFIGGPRRRRSSLAQLTDILREWGGGGAPRRQRAPLSRRETLADLARSLPWARHEPPPRRRRDSSADSGIKSMASKRRDSKVAPQDFRADFPGYWERKDSTTIMPSRERRIKRRSSGDDNKERRDSVDGHRHRRDSTVAVAPPRIVATHKKRRASPPTLVPSNYVDESSDPGPSTHTPSVTIVAIHEPSRSDGECPTMTMPTIITSAVTPSPTSPTVPTTNATQTSQSTQASAFVQATQATATTPSGRTPPNLGGRRDSTTQCGRARRDSRAAASPERRLGRLQRQATAFDDPNGPPGARRRDSGPSLGPDDESRVRRDSLSPDSAARPRRERSQLSPDRAGGELSPSAARRRSRLRRQASCARMGRARSPESSSCSSRDPSPGARPPERTMIRRQSTTEEILIARGFRRQSTTEEMIRCRNFRRQSSQSDDACTRARGRRDSSTQILDGTIGTMTVETTSTFFDSSTQTGK